MEKEPKEESSKGKNVQDKPMTAIEVLKSWPKAMQVGPQPHLRKSFYLNKETKESQ